MACDQWFRAIRPWPSPGRPGKGGVIYRLFMEPGSLVMERKMLLGIKPRAERPQPRLARLPLPAPRGTNAPEPRSSLAVGLKVTKRYLGHLTREGS